MEYRTLPHGNEKISVIGIGSSVIGEQKEKDIMETVWYALEHGVNYFDMAGGHASIFSAYGKALQEKRKEVMLQVHFGADYTSGAYGWNITLEGVKKSVDWQLANLKTDYIDFGFIHCLDEAADFQKYRDNGVLDYILTLKNQGVIRHIGLSTHAPALANAVLDTKLLDMIMFSINPMYDYGQGDYANGSEGERYRLYRRCAAEGVGISVMKPFSGGQLLHQNTSPFHVALTTTQCIQYALDKPGVLTVLGGPKNVEELKQILSYCHATQTERDYSMIAMMMPEESVGGCVYCKHCHPCPAGLDIGLINQYYDLSLAGDALAKEHYLTLEKTAEHCIGCGHCNVRCPFHVKQKERMQEIQRYFGR